LRELKTFSERAVYQIRINGWQVPEDLKKLADFEPEILEVAPTKIKSLSALIAQVQKKHNSSQSNESDLIRSYLSPHITNFFSLVSSEEEIMSNSKKIYLPMLRGLRPLQVGGYNPNDKGYKFDASVDNYFDRTLTDYFQEISDKQKIITGLHLYDETRRLLLGTLSDRKKVREFEAFISSTFFEGKDFSITPREGKDVLYVRIGPDETHEKPIYDLGDGIQAIIILTYPLFFYKGEDAIVCFEEPETHLHPGLQRLFIETLLKDDFKKFQYFITTHSNHFLDLTADYNEISVYAFSKTSDESDKIIVENVESEHENTLQLIGARASSVFLSNCTIWVEGLTDRLYLRKYMEVCQQQPSIKRKFREDYHYSFVEYGGSNITHWSFLDENDPENPTIDVTRLCSKLFLVTDNDGANLKVDIASGFMKKRKADRFKRLKKALGVRYYCLKCREIENLLTPAVLMETINRRAKKGVVPKFKSNFAQSDYEKIPLGTFIKMNVNSPGRKYEEGTILDKPGFCREAVQQVKTISDLSPEALRLTKKLYDFIAKNNS
jgi:hypothetical protein